MRKASSKIQKLVICLFLLFAISAKAQTPVAVHGQLSISTNRLKDKNGNNYQLRGMSFFWSNWQGKYWNYEVVKWLRDDWHCNVVRAAMGISPNDGTGYLNQPELEKQKMFTVIEAAIDLGIYVIVDWHSHSAQNEVTQAKAFFAEVAQKYGKYPNILYETYNEPPSGGIWGSVLKTYHQAVVSEIRKYDTKNVIILGTGFYSQEVVEAASDPLAGTNLCYALHYYAATHFFSDKIGAVSGKNQYCFISEFGTCDASGAGSINEANSNTWWNEADKYGASWCNWAVSDVSEAASIMKPGSSIAGGWNPSSDLTASGVIVRNKLRGYATDPLPTGIAPYITSSPKNQSVPEGAAATFSVEAVGDAPLSYQWYFKGAAISTATGASYTINSAMPADTGTYYCVVTNKIGSTTTKTVRLDTRYRSTYFSTAQTIPGVIQFETFDKGGQNIGYYDASVGNTGGTIRMSEDVDIQAIQGQTDAYNIGYTDNGEWMSYSVNVGWDGDYTLDVYFASQTDGGSFSVDIDGKTLVASTTLGVTGGWTTYAKKSVTTTLTQGAHIIKFKIDKSGANLDYMEFKSLTTPNIAPLITAQPKGATVKVGKKISLYVSATGATPMTYQWYKNGVAISGATAATYEVASATDADGGDYTVIVTNKLGTATSAVATITTSILSAYLGNPAVLPGRVFCKNFDEGGEGVAYHDASTTNEGGGNYRPEAVDMETTLDGGSGYAIDYVVSGEWLEYSVMVSYTGTYSVDFRIASAKTTGSLSLSVDGTEVISSVAVPNTGDWTAWANLTKSLKLTAGPHIIRLTAKGSDFNINYMDFTATSCEATVSLAQGWNLFALPLLPTDASIGKVFATISDVIVKTNDKFYRAAQAAALNSLNTLEAAQGYLVFNPGTATTITITGTPITTNPSFGALNTGWNLVGISASAVATSTLDAKVIVVKNLDNFYEPANVLSGIKTLSNGKAYFVKSK